MTKQELQAALNMPQFPMSSKYGTLFCIIPQNGGRDYGIFLNVLMLRSAI